MRGRIHINPSKPNAPLTRLKQSDPEDVRWAYELGQNSTAVQARAAIKEKLGIEIKWDSQYSVFRNWYWRREMVERHKELNDEATKEFISSTAGPALRAYTLQRLHATSDAMRDPKLAIELIKLEHKEEELVLLRRKVELMEKVAARKITKPKSTLTEEDKYARLTNIVKG